MARLDGTIERLLKQAGGLELQIETGSGINLKTQDAVVPVLRQPLTTQQIVGALGEILPGDLKADFPRTGQSQFPYQSPSGPVLVKLDYGGGKARASIHPFAPAAVPAPAAPPPSASGRPSEIELPPEDEARIELATPSEMLQLAVQPGAAPSPYAQTSTSPGATSALLSSEPRGKLDGLLTLMLSRKASDLHLSSQNPPMLRVDGEMCPIDGAQPLSPEALKAMLWSIAPERNKAQWEETKDTDFAYETSAARFRVNIFMDRKGIGSVMRQIPTKILTAEEMGLSKPILDLCSLTKGLVLVTGPTGSGKSTTLAAMVDYVNRTRSDHIITIEDPIEFVHPNKKCLVNQREVKVHTDSFKQALRAALREDPDIVLVGELRDLETIAIAIETAETGHLVFGTLHTNTAPSTVDRVIDQFPADRQEQIRMMLSESLKAVITQCLVKKIGGGRAPALEVLMATGSVANLIREGKTFQLPSIMQTGKAAGMVTMNDALMDLVKRKVVKPEDAYMKAVAKTEFKSMLERNGFPVEAAAS
jgi:twitching motility protein PilT